MAVIQFHDGTVARSAAYRLAQRVTFNRDVLLQKIEAPIRSREWSGGSRARVFAAVWGDEELQNLVADSAFVTSDSTDWQTYAFAFQNVRLTAGVTYYIGTDRHNFEGDPEIRVSAILTHPHTHSGGPITATLGPVAASQYIGDPNYDLALELTVVPANMPPHAPTLAYPSAGTVLDRGIGQRFSWVFNDPNEGDPQGDSQSAYRVRHRTGGATAWTDTGWIASPSRHHDFPAGAFSVGDHEWQAATKDSQGLVGPFSPSGFFTAGDPVTAHSITDPANGAALGTATYPVVWSTPEQDAYQVQVTDGEAVLFDTGVVESATTRQQALDFPDNEVTRSIRVRIRYGGLWSEWAAVTVTVAYTPPAAPLLSVTGDDAAGTITVDIIHPEPTGSQPVVQSHDVWVREAGDTGDGMRLAADLYWNEAYVWWLPASGVDYQFRVRAVVASGAGTYSAWVDYSTAQVASNGNGTLTIMDPLFRAHTIHITDNDDGTIAVSEPPTSWPALTSGTF